jgi:(p)ppGpp synthase/HD superfamily hydrolase
MITSDVLEKAILFAVKAHEGQKRKGDKRPYIMHPLSVMWRIYHNKKSANMYLLAAAAILHDTVEDCGITIEQIAKEFGHHVAALVAELTLDKAQYTLIGKKEYLLQEMNKMSSYALAIKLCDRLDNVSDLKSTKKDFVIKYVEETEYILNNLNRTLSATHKRLIRQIHTQLRKIRKWAEMGLEIV